MVNPHVHFPHGVRENGLCGDRVIFDRFSGTPLDAQGVRKSPMVLVESKKSYLINNNISSSTP
jgi:hypothetical protein